MSGAVVTIVSAFFIIGITVGIITVVALSVLRPRQRPRQRGWPGRRLEYGPPDPDWDEGGPEEHPRWPGETGSDFSGR